jgi:hypothetical protein
MVGDPQSLLSLTQLPMANGRPQQRRKLWVEDVAISLRQVLKMAKELTETLGE